MLGFLVVVALAGPDAGTARARTDVRRLIDDLVRKQTEAATAQRTTEIAELRQLAATAPAAERALLERVAKVLESELQPPQLLREFTGVLRDAGKLARGRLDEERALAGAWLSLPVLAQNFGLDPEPSRREALAVIRELAGRYPKDGRVQGLLASTLMEAKADDTLALAALKRCAELDPDTWCPRAHARMVAELERPRCSGPGLVKALTATGAKEAPDRPDGAVLTGSDTAWVLEAKPFLTSADFATIAVDDDGNLAMDVTPAASRRLAQETARLLQVPGGGVVLKLGSDVLMAARLREPIDGGRLRAARGAGRPAFKLEDLCKKPERPVVPAELKLGK